MPSSPNPRRILRGGCNTSPPDKGSLRLSQPPSDRCGPGALSHPPAGTPHRPRASQPRLKASTLRSRAASPHTHGVVSAKTSWLLRRMRPSREAEQPLVRAPGQGSPAPRLCQPHSLIGHSGQRTPPPTRLTSQSQPEVIQASDKRPTSRLYPDPLQAPKPPTPSDATSTLFPVPITLNHLPRVFQMSTQPYNCL